MAIFRGNGGAGDSNSDATITAVTAQATIATTKASEASVSATAAELAYDNFDDRYLGAKASAPTLDNDGDTLLVGAMYFDTPSDALLVWTGTVWKDTGVSTSTGDLLAANNLSDVASVATARSNLGLATNSVVISSVSDWPVTLSSSILYIIDGAIDMGTRSLEVPAGGLNLSGLDLSISKLTSTEASYTLFTSPVGGSGNLLGRDFTMDISGTGSQVFDITDATGFNAVEWSRVNWENCTSLGTITGYRQGLEEGTGRFGGSPTLTLAGTWIGGYRAAISIVRSLDAGMTGALFSAGAGFTMGSRFLTDVNVDLPASASLVDFAPANFTAPSLFQLRDMLITRNGVTNVDDTNYCPNITASDTKVDWRDNIGIGNTHVGGHLEVTTEVVTVITTVDVFTPILGTVSTDHMEHFSNPSAWRLQHLGNSPHEFQLISNMAIDGPANDVLTVRVRKYDASTTTTSTVHTQTRVVNNLQGSRDIAYFSITTVLDLNIDDYCYLDIANGTTTGDVTAELESGFVLSTR